MKNDDENSFTYTKWFVFPRRINKPNDGSLRGWLLGTIRRDEKIIIKIQQNRNAFLDTINRTLTFFGGELFNVILLPCLFWWAPLWFACTYSYMLGSTFAFGNYVKNYFALPRPRSPPVWHTSARLESDWGFPSTHTIGSCLLPYFVCWYLIEESYPTMPMIAKLFIISVSAIWSGGVVYSRLYLGAHSPIDVYGGMVCSAILGLFWYGYATPIYQMVIAPDFPWMAFLAPLFFLIIHPISTPPTPLTGDSATLLGMSAGITLGVWLRVHTTSVDKEAKRLSLLDSSLPSFAQMLTMPFDVRMWAVGAGVALAKFVIGTIFMLIVRHFGKKLWRAIALWFVSVLQPSTRNRRKKMSVVTLIKNKSGKTKTNGHTARSSVLDETSAGEDFFLNVDLPVKYGTYMFLGMVGTCGAPMLFQLLGFP